MSNILEFDEEESPKQMKDPSHVAEEHNDIPWDEWEEEPLTNWWDQPDLDEDDEVTKLCKRVLIASASKDLGEGNIEIKADKIHALVIKFVLKVHQRVKERGGSWRKEAPSTSEGLIWNAVPELRLQEL
ncbi:hypothetical protein MPSEU_000645600 [Mayamaea pseudoterrestris]|nr:hypothetical protein MPSEU_000645600 [Mayamaea pseudoterrestris]